MTAYDTCPTYAPILGYLAAAFCMILSNLGAACGTWKSGKGICELSTLHPSGIMKNLICVIMSGVLGIYGLIVSILIAGAIPPPNINDGATLYSQYNAYAHMSAGLCTGLACLASGWATGVAGESGCKAVAVRAHMNLTKGTDEGDSGRIYIGYVTIMSFAGACGLYGFIVSLIILSSKPYYCNVYE